MAYRTEHYFTIERELRPGEMAEERIAVVGKLDFAHAVFELARERHPDDGITLRHGARIVRKYAPDRA